MKNLVITFDYELYGDGTGCVFEQMIHPTKQILDVCEKHNISTTIFFEVSEYIKLKEQWDLGNTMGYENNPVEAIENQILEAHKNGHDIQLHLHPQWVKGEYVNNKWDLDMSNWRLGDFSVAGVYTIYDILKEGKDVIEGLIHRIDPSYECYILRAGGYNVLPSKEIYEAMIELNMKVDSSSL